MIAVDFETRLVENGYLAPEPICLSWADDNSSGVIHCVLEPDLAEAKLREVLENGGVAHNLSFEFRVIWQWFPNLRSALWESLWAGRLRCTQVRQRLTDIAEGRGQDGRSAAPSLVASCAAHMITLDADKGDRKKIIREYGSLHSAPAEELPWRYKYSILHSTPVSEWEQEAFDYALEDSVFTLRLFNAQEGYELPTENLETRASVTCGLTGAWGLAVDQEMAQQKYDRDTERMRALLPALDEAGFISRKRKRDADKPIHECDIKTNQKTIGEMVIALWPQAPRTPTGKPKIGADTLKHLDSPVFADYVEYKKTEKRRSTFLDPLTKKSIINPSFWSLGAATSRTSSSNPNLQNLPREGGVRDCYVPREGHVLIACDYSTQELRTLAQFLHWLTDGQSVLARRYQDDPDFDAHQAFADSSGLSRQESKAANFGFPGGLGVAKFVEYAQGYGLDITEREARDIKNAWFRQWPEMREFFDFISKTCNGVSSVTIPTSGFKRACYDGRAFSQLCNTAFQATGAHCTKNALNEITRRCYDPVYVENSVLLGSRPVNIVHDEIIVEVPEDVCQEAADEISEIMNKKQEEYTPDIPSRTDCAIMRRWLKHAEGAREADGSHKIWEE